jgi:hypothetical protein
MDPEPDGLHRAQNAPVPPERLRGAIESGRVVGALDNHHHICLHVLMNLSHLASASNRDATNAAGKTSGTAGGT